MKSDMLLTHNHVNETAFTPRLRRFTTHVVVPTGMGATIYILFRTTNLLVFDWLKAIHLSEFAFYLRHLSSEITLPGWLLYSMPDGLWAYAITSWIILIWDRAPPLAWLSAGAVLAIGSELGQLIGIVPGTYQHRDVAFYICGFVAACLQLEITHEASLPFRVRFIGYDRFRLWKR